MKCSALTRTGRPCRARARRYSRPPRCPAHAGLPPEAGGGWFYQSAFTLPEIADLAAARGEPVLQGELQAVRVTTRRILQLLDQTVEPAAYSRLARLLFAGANTVARLLREQRALEEDSGSFRAAVMAEALDQLSIDKGVPL